MTDAPRPSPHGEELPPEEGIRRDHAGTAAGPAGVAPGGEAAQRAEELIQEPPGEEGDEER
jgi:hypothetical protein